MDIKNNKRLQYLLLGMVIIIWGLVIWQFYNYTGADSTNYEVAKAALPLQSQSNLQKETFQLNFNYKDPFLGKRFTGIATTATTGQSSKSRFERALPAGGIQTSNPKKMKRPTFPAIIYKGYSINKNQVSRVFLYINGKSVTLQKGEAYEGMKLRQMTKDSVVFYKNRERKAFFRNG